jgi:hypothetical protein
MQSSKALRVQKAPHIEIEVLNERQCFFQANRSQAISALHTGISLLIENRQRFQNPRMMPRVSSSSSFATARRKTRDQIRKKHVHFNIALLNFPKEQKSQKSPPKKEKRKQAILFLKTCQDTTGGWEHFLAGISMKLRGRLEAQFRSKTKRWRVGPSASRLQLPDAGSVARIILYRLRTYGKALR